MVCRVSSSDSAFRLLRELLAFEQAARPSARRALEHGFLAGLPPLPLSSGPRPRNSEAPIGRLEAADQELLDPSRRTELLRELRERFLEELAACRGPA